MKGNGLFERNLVICEHSLATDRGIRIGLSFGGGATAERYCQDSNCEAEHSNGVMRNNIVLNCSRDVGIYLNRAQNSYRYNNLLHNNLGLDIRFPSSSATLVNNIISGRIKERDGAVAHAKNNLIDSDCVGKQRYGCSFDQLYANPAASDLRLTRFDNPLQGQALPITELTDDFCSAPRHCSQDLGPFNTFKVSSA